MTQKEILRGKITNLIERYKSENRDIERIARDNELMRDYIANLGAINELDFMPDDELKGLVVKFAGNSNQIYKLHPHAAEQAGEKLGIPAGFIRDLATSTEKWKYSLAARMLWDFTDHSERQRVLIRIVGNEIRGILSDHYKRISSPMIINAYWDALKNIGAEIYRSHYDGLRSYLEAISPEVIDVPTKLNGVLHIAIGSRLSISDFGLGAVDFRSFIMQVVCLNGLTSERLYREIHLGKRLPDDIQLSENTYRKDSEFTASLITDFVKNIYDPGYIEKSLAGIQDAASIPIDLDSEIRQLPKVGMMQNEIDRLKEKLIKSDPDDGLSGQLSAWKFSQAISAVARDHENENRKRELEDIAGHLLNRFNKQSERLSL